MSPKWEASQEPGAGRWRLALTYRQAILICASSVATALACAGLCAGAILVPAPAGVAPLVALCCVGAPMLSAWQLPAALNTVRSRRPRARALAELRRSLEQLPETDHPLGL